MDLSKYPEYEHIPFELIDITHQVKVVGGKAVSIVDHATGEMVEGRTIGEQKSFWKDNANYIKMYPQGVDLIQRLSAKGTSVLTYILKNMKVGQTEIELRVSEVQLAHKNLAGGRYYQGLEELLRYGYMVKKKGPKNRFFLNPNFFFNGDRKWIKQGA